MEVVTEDLQILKRRLRARELSSKWQKFISLATFVGAMGAAALSHSQHQKQNSPGKRGPKPKRV